MLLNVKIKIDLGDAFTDFDRLRLSDEIVKSFKRTIQKSENKNVKLISISGEIEKEKKNGK
jgi:hypothetical protein